MNKNIHYVKIMLIVWIATPTGWLAMTVPAYG